MNSVAAADPSGRDADPSPNAADPRRGAGLHEEGWAARGHLWGRPAQEAVRHPAPDWWSGSAAVAAASELAGLWENGADFGLRFSDCGENQRAAAEGGVGRRSDEALWSRSERPPTCWAEAWSCSW